MTNPAFLLVLTAWCAVLLVLVLPALRPPTDRHITSFADFYAVPLTPATHRLIAASLAWTRRWRVVGGVGGGVLWWATHPDGTPFNLFAIAAGMAIGNLLAELTVRSPRRGTIREADLARRSVTDHVQRFVVLGLGGLWALTAVVVAAAATGLTVPDRLPKGDLLVGVGALVVGGAALPLAARIARRPAPRDDHAVAAVRHAIRTASISSVLGGGAVVLSAAMYRVAFVAVLEDGERNGVVRHLDNAAMWVAFAAMVAGLALVLGSFPRRAAERTQTVPA